MDAQSRVHRVADSPPAQKVLHCVAPSWKVESMIRTRGLILGAVVLAGLIAGMPGDALAKKKHGNKKTLAVTVNGKKLKVTPRTIDFGAGGGTIGFSVQGQKIPGGYRGTVRTVLIACATLWPPPALGTPLLACLGSYSELNVRKPAAAKYWQQIAVDDSTTVIIDAYDGTNVTGHFTSTVPSGPSSPGLPPVTLVGSFSGPVRFENPNR
jgi:hypothetical protein